MIDVERWVGIPYAQLRCWDLVAAVYFEMWDLYLGEPEDQLVGIKAGDWLPVAAGEERPGDVIVFDTSAHEPHVGLVLEQGKFLHTMSGLNSCCDSYRAMRWQSRIRKIYRRSHNPARS